MTANRLLLAIVAIISVCVAATALGATAYIVIGGWRHIQNISDPNIQELGQWAVTEANKVSPSRLLTFSKVTDALKPALHFETTKYCLLLIDASRYGVMLKYDVLLIVKNGNPRKLLSFEGAHS
uniref:Cystatin domain-containing protein n=1 Tax=Leersia perrieri TaxID=77586 RepID=A0A0D9WYJ0_9ORYZ